MLLGVNIDHVATLREARGTHYPDPLEAALIALQSGADSITVHLREDRRHIQYSDVERLSKVAGLRMNLEMAVTAEMLTIAEDIQPADCCLVPEKRAELTTEGGLDVAIAVAEIASACDRLQAGGVRVSLFVDPDSRQLDAAKQTGAEVVELHTGSYADAASEGERKAELLRIQTAAAYASSLGLIVHAGHGLHYENVSQIAVIADIKELNIGHSIVAQSVFTGFSVAVAEMKRLMNEARAE